MPTVENQLAALRPDQIGVRRALVLEWYDGPEVGFMELSEPASTWHFQKLAERFDEDDADSRLYLLSAAGDGVIDQVAELAEETDRSGSGIWVPSWQFPDPARRQAADDAIERAVSEMAAGSVIVRSRDLLHIEDFWLTTVGIRLPLKPTSR